MNLAVSPARDTQWARHVTRTKDYEECRALVRAATSTHRLSIGDNSDFLNFAHHRFTLGKLHVDLVQVDTSNGFEVQKEKPNDTYYFQFLLRGSCTVEGLSSPAVRAQRGNILVIEPNQVTHESWPDKCLQVMVRAPRETIEQALSAELGRRITGRVTFQPVARDIGIASWLRHFVGVQLHADEQPSIMSDTRVLRDFERTLLTMLLAGVPHNKSEELADSPSRIAPYYVKRAEDYIRSAATGDITMEDIAKAACISERTLFYGFKRWRNTTPMAYVWDVRLALARKELKNARRTGGTVSQAAVNAGFTTFSHFAKIYKARYGETPSATLRGLGAAPATVD
jgi:AraC-like DNA-binding protein